MPTNPSLPAPESRWYHFWFRPVSAAGFGMMRVSFAVVAFWTMALQWPNMDRYYGPEGILPHSLVSVMVRESWRFSIIDSVSVSTAEWLYILMLVSFVLVAIGLYTRVALGVALVLLFSFHEYGIVALDGGDTMLRLIGFILIVSPCHRTFTLSNLLTRFRIAKSTGHDQDPSARTMPIWPYRLLLWQLIIVYGSSMLLKLSGSAWKNGEAVAIVLHHDTFSRLSTEIADVLSGSSPTISAFTLISQGIWLLLLPLGLLSLCGLIRTRAFDTLKRALLLCGILVHGSIAILLDVGTFSFVMFTAYLGLLLDNDFRTIRVFFHRYSRGTLVILFDGRCGLCNRMMITFRALDWFRRLEFVNLHDPDMRKRYAPEIDLKTLTKSMHARLPSGSFRLGFFAFRSILGVLPATKILQPLLFIPGIPFIGERVYAFVAAHR